MPAESIVERILTDRRFFGLEEATPVQRAWCRVADGVPLGELWEDEAVRRCFSSVVPPELRPREMVGCAGDRTGKSMILASIAIARARFTDLDKRFEREQAPMIPIVSVLKDNAKMVLGHIVACMQQPHLVSALGKQPTKETCTLLNKSRIPIRIKVVANRRAAASLASSWHIVTLVDEVFFQQGAADSDINLDALRVMCLKRLLPGGQIFHFGTGWFPTGPAYELMQQHEGAPTRECIVAHSDGPSMNPAQWTPEFVEELRTSKDQRKQDAYVTGALGQFLSTIGGLLSEPEVNAVLRYQHNVHHGDKRSRWWGMPSKIEPVEGQRYVATADPAARRNAFTLEVSHKDGDMLIVDFAEQWVPKAGMPLDLGEVIDEVAEVLHEYGLDTVYSDQWSSDALKVVARDRGIHLLEHEWHDQQAALQAVVDGVRLLRCSLPRFGEMRRDLMNIRRKMSPTGPRLYLQQTPDGRHADFVPPLAMAWEIAPEGTVQSVQRRLSGLVADDTPKRERDPWDGVGVLEPVEHSALDELFG